MNFAPEEYENDTRKIRGSYNYKNKYGVFSVEGRNAAKMGKREK